MIDTQDQKQVTHTRPLSHKRFVTDHIIDIDIVLQVNE